MDSLLKALWAVLCLGLVASAAGEGPKASGSSPSEGKNKTRAYLYNGTTALMETSRAINFTLRSLDKDSKLLAYVVVPDAANCVIKANVVNDTKNKVVINSFSLSFNGSSMNSSGSSKFTALSFDFETVLNLTTSYWRIANLTVNYTAQVDGKTYEGKGESLDVAPDGPGYTRANVDLSCERAHSTCAPNRLSWTCDGQQFKSSKLANDTAAGGKKDQAAAASAAAVVVTFPGFRFQPVFAANSSKAQIRFGYSWDCDALIPLPVWTGLLISLGLMMIVYWAVSMITGQVTPDRFDDPKGKQIIVPTVD